MLCKVFFVIYMIVSHSEESYSHAVLNRSESRGWPSKIFLFSCYWKGNNLVQQLGNNILVTLLLAKQNNSM